MTKSTSLLLTCIFLGATAASAHAQDPAKKPPQTSAITTLRDTITVAQNVVYPTTPTALREPAVTAADRAATTVGFPIRHACDDQTPTLLGTSRQDTLQGTPEPDVIVGLESADIIDGNASDDTICAGDGADSVQGGIGDDYIAANLPGDNCDFVDGGEGDDHVVAGHTAALPAQGPRKPPCGFFWLEVQGGGGDDRIEGSPSKDNFFGGTGNDYLQADPTYSGRGFDRLDGGPGDDYIEAGPGPGDFCVGGTGHDQFLGCDDIYDIDQPDAENRF